MAIQLFAGVWAGVALGVMSRDVEIVKDRRLAWRPCSQAATTMRAHGGTGTDKEVDMGSSKDTGLGPSVGNWLSDFYVGVVERRVGIARLIASDLHFSIRLLPMIGGDQSPILSPLVIKSLKRCGEVVRTHVLHFLERPRSSRTQYGSCY